MSRIARLAGAVFVAAVAAATVRATPAAAQVPEAISAPAALESCLTEENALSVLVLIDEAEVPEGAPSLERRIDAAVAAVRGLDRLGGERGVSVEVFVAGYSAGFVVHGGGWQQLGDAGTVTVVDALAGIADLERGEERDLPRALLGARDALRSAAACPTLLWFPAGGVDIVSGEERPEYEERRAAFEERVGEDEVPTDIDELYQAIGEAWLCTDEDAIASAYRTDGISMITMTSFGGEAVEPPVLRAITTGMGADGAPCGAAPEPDGRELFVSAATVEDLISDLDRMIGDLRGFTLISDSTSGVHEWSIPFGTTVFRVVATSTNDEFPATIISPEGDFHTLEFGEGPFSLGTALVEPTWFSQRSFSLEVRLDPGIASWVGPWSMRFGEETGARSRVALKAELVVTPIPGEGEIVAGDPTVVSFTVTSTDGVPVPPPARETIRPEAIGPDGEVIAGEWAGEEGRVEVEVTTTAGDAASTLSFIPNATLIAGPASFTYQGEPMTVTVIPPPVPPAIVTDRVDLGTIVGVGLAESSVPIVVEGTTVPGCVFFTGLSGSKPEEAGEIDIVVFDETGARVPGAADCARYLATADPIVVPQEGELQLFVTATPEDEAEGPVVFQLEFVVAEGLKSAESRAVVEIGFTMERRVNDDLTLVLFAFFTALGIALALVLVWMWTEAGARFRTLTAGRGASVDVVAWADGRLQRVRGDRATDLYFEFSDFRELGPVGGRSVSVLGLDFAAYAGFLAARASVTGDGARVVTTAPRRRRDYRVAGVPLNLHGVWVFVVGDAAVDWAREAGEGAALRGRLIVLADGDRRPPDLADVVAVASAVIAAHRSGLVATRRREPPQAETPPEEVAPEATPGEASPAPGPPGPAAPIPAGDDAVAAGAALAGLDGAQPVPAAEAPEEVPGVEAVPPPEPEPEPAPPPAPPPAPDGVPGPMAAAATLDLDWGPPPEADDPGEQVEHVEQSEQSEQSEQAEPAEQEQPAAKRKDDLYLPEWAEEDHYHLVIEPGDEDS